MTLRPLGAALSVTLILGCSHANRNKAGIIQADAQTYYLPAEMIDGWRKEAARLRAAPRPFMRVTPRWIAPVQDPNAILLAFPELKLQEQRSLIAYQWVDQTIPYFYNLSDSFTKVYAIYPGACYEDPVTLPADELRRKRRSHPNHPYPETPIPWMGSKDEDILSVLQFSASIQSYLEAVVFKLEVQDFPGYWEDHWAGKDKYSPWSTHAVIDADPDQYAEAENEIRVRKQTPLKQRKDARPSINWNWAKPKPSKWMPTIRSKGSEIEISFYSISLFGIKSLYKHTVIFSPGSYTPRGWFTEILATGGQGWVLS